MSLSTSRGVPYPFPLTTSKQQDIGNEANISQDVTITLPNVRGKIPFEPTSRLRSMWLEAHGDPSKILAQPCAFDGLSSRMIEQAGFQMIFISGYAVASTHGIPDAGYIAMQEMCDKIQECVRQVSIPVMADGDTGYGSPLNVRRTVQSFAHAGAAGIMIEDQTWPKRCGHTRGKSVVSREEAFARIKAACDARNEGRDIFILGRTDALILGWEEAMYRAQRFKELGVDAVFVEALPDKEAMKKCLESVDIPMMANLIEGGLTENIPAEELALIGFSAVCYPFTLVAAKLKAIHEALENLKASMTIGAPPMILPADEVHKAVGFEEYWELEKRYAHD
ncbi:unnamed protein product [Clonostachys rosea]|uniref:Carboxyvinyl-carboxyphosphonate phosphorylmutase n=1 Tax=Bionectria ochroleuca TaxID=29856 RepID=A0ABY6ULK8_BIOOC|nr:unnamed protein product [Clonostachys rosea]